MVAAMRRDLHLTDVQIANRVRVEATAPAVERRLRERLGPSFAGAWIPEGGDRLTVAVTDTSAITVVRAQGADATVVSRSEKQLDTTTGRARPSAGPRRASESTAGTSTLLANTRGVVAAAARRRTFAPGSFAGPAAAEARPSPSARPPKRPARSTTSVAATSTSSTATRSARSGFAVNGGFVTAGHCGRAGSPTLGLNTSPGHLRRLVVPRQRLRLGPHQRLLDAPAVGQQLRRRQRDRGRLAGRRDRQPRSAGPGAPPAGAAARSRPATMTVNYPQGTGLRPDPHQRLRRARRLRRLLHLRRTRPRASPPAAPATAPPAAPPIYPAGQRDPRRVRPHPDHHRRRRRHPLDRNWRQVHRRAGGQLLRRRSACRPVGLQRHRRAELDVHRRRHAAACEPSAWTSPGAPPPTARPFSSPTATATLRSSSFCRRPATWSTRRPTSASTSRAGTARGARLIIWDCHGGANQKWRRG